MGFFCLLMHSCFCASLEVSQRDFTGGEEFSPWMRVSRDEGCSNDDKSDMDLFHLMSPKCKEQPG